MDGDDASLGIENHLLSAIKYLGSGDDDDLLADGASATKFARGPSLPVTRIVYDALKALVATRIPQKHFHFLKTLRWNFLSLKSTWSHFCTWNFWLTKNSRFQFILYIFDFLAERIRTYANVENVHVLLMKTYGCC
jgi:hypothetical protein